MFWFFMLQKKWLMEKKNIWKSWNISAEARIELCSWSVLFLNTVSKKLILERAVVKIQRSNPVTVPTCVSLKETLGPQGRELLFLF